MKKGLYEIFMLVDESGSMSSLASDVAGGIKAFIEEQRKLPGTRIFSLAFFDKDPFSALHTPILRNKVDRVDIRYVNTSKVDEYRPRGSTPLLDAVGECIDSLGNRLRDLKERDRPEKVVFCIFTDGKENSSERFTKFDILQKIKHQNDKYAWDFVYLGANQDSFAESASIGINPIYVDNYIASPEGVLKSYRSASYMVQCSTSGAPDASSS